MNLDKVEIGSAHRAIGSRSESGPHIVATPRLPISEEIWASGHRLTDVLSTTGTGAGSNPFPLFERACISGFLKKWMDPFAQFFRGCARRLLTWLSIIKDCK
jgi:hypothetical protein